MGQKYVEIKLLKYLMSEYYFLFPYFLNQAHASLPTGSLKLLLSTMWVCMYVCVCVSASEAINN